MIYIGGIDYYCLECQIFLNNPIANLPKIEYDGRCSLIGRFERGTDTRAILALLFSYLQKNYPFVNQITFEDYSSRTCADQREIDLAAFHYVFDLKTWYMTHMNARFAEPSEQIVFNKKTSEFQESKKATSWAKYDSFVTMRHPLPEKEMQEMFQASKTWTEFFNAMKSRVEMGDLCTYMAPWISTFVRSFANLQMEL